MCTVSRARGRVCKDNAGGIKNIYLCTFDPAITFSFDSDEQISDVSAALTMYKYELPKGAGQWDENWAGNVENGAGSVWQPVVDMNLWKLSKEDRKEITALAKTDLWAVVETYNGHLIWLGRQCGLDVAGGGTRGGRNKGDGQMYNMVLQGEELELARFVVPAATPFADIANITVTTAA